MIQTLFDKQSEMASCFKRPMILFFLKVIQFFITFITNCGKENLITLIKISNSDCSNTAIFVIIYETELLQAIKINKKLYNRNRF